MEALVAAVAMNGSRTSQGGPKPKRKNAASDTTEPTKKQKGAAAAVAKPYVIDSLAGLARLH